jgi:hypothetical protein
MASIPVSEIGAVHSLLMLFGLMIFCGLFELVGGPLMMFSGAPIVVHSL